MRYDKEYLRRRSNWQEILDNIVLLASDKYKRGFLSKYKQSAH